MQRALARLRPSEPVALGLIAAVFTTFWSLCSISIHRAFHSNGWDLGLIHQTLWNSAHGRLFEYSFRDISYAGDHWQPLLLVLVPLEWIHGGPEALLILQAVALAATALPLYASARGLGCTGRGSFALVGMYMLGLGVAQTVSFDFHMDAFAPLLAFTALWGLARGRAWVYVASALLILGLKEDGAFLTLALCWIAWFEFRVRVSAGAAVLAIAYMFVATYVIIPHFRGDDLNPFVERYGYLGDSPLGVLWGMVAHPNLVLDQLSRTDSVVAVLTVFLSASFLPILVPRLLPALAMVTMLPLLSKQPEQGALDVHYLLVPATVALVMGVVALRGVTRTRIDGIDADARFVRKDRLLSAVLIGVAVFVFALRSPLPPSLAADLDRFSVDEHASVAEEFVKDVPRDAIVSAQSPFVPHLTERQKLYQFPRVLNAQFVLVDAYGPIPVGDLSAGYEACLAALPRLGFDKARAEDGISLWIKVRPAELVPDVPLSCSGQHP